jgi:ABC-type transporter Mla MlaB component
MVSTMQRGIRTGHSSYVEMHEANNLVIHNIKLRINSMKPFIDKELHEKLISFLPAMLNGYEFTLTPNGTVKNLDLDHLLSLDSDITMLLLSLEYRVKHRMNHIPIEEIMSFLKELIDERRRLLNDLRA